MSKAEYSKIIDLLAEINEKTARLDEKTARCESLLKEMKDIARFTSITKATKEKAASSPNVRQFAINSYVENASFFTEVIKVLSKEEEEELLSDKDVVAKISKKKDESAKRKAAAEFIYSKKVMGHPDIIATIRAIKDKAFEKEEVKKPNVELVADESDDESD